jgi:chromosome segregation ATPase
MVAQFAEGAATHPEVETLQGQLAQVTATVASKDDTIRSMQAQLSETTGKMVPQATQFAEGSPAIHPEVEALQCQLREALEKSYSQSAQFADTIASKDDAIRSLQAQLSETTGKMVAQFAEASAIHPEVETLQGQLAQVTAAVTSKDDTIRSMQAQLSEATGKLVSQAIQFVDGASATYPEVETLQGQQRKALEKSYAQSAQFVDTIASKDDVIGSLQAQLSETTGKMVAQFAEGAMATHPEVETLQGQLREALEKSCAQSAQFADIITTKDATIKALTDEFAHEKAEARQVVKAPTEAQFSHDIIAKDGIIQSLQCRIAATSRTTAAQTAQFQSTIERKTVKIQTLKAQLLDATRTTVSHSETVHMEDIIAQFQSNIERKTLKIQTLKAQLLDATRSTVSNSETSHVEDVIVSKDLMINELQAKLMEAQNKVTGSVDSRQEFEAVLVLRDATIQSLQSQLEAATGKAVAHVAQATQFEVAQAASQMVISHTTQLQNTAEVVSMQTLQSQLTAASNAAVAQASHTTKLESVLLVKDAEIQKLQSQLMEANATTQPLVYDRQSAQSITAKDAIIQRLQAHVLEVSSKVEAAATKHMDASAMAEALQSQLTEALELSHRQATQSADTIRTNDAQIRTLQPQLMEAVGTGTTLDMHEAALSASAPEFLVAIRQKDAEITALQNSLVKSSSMVTEQVHQFNETVTSKDNTITLFSDQLAALKEKYERDMQESRQATDGMQHQLDTNMRSLQNEHTRIDSERKLELARQVPSLRAERDQLAAELAELAESTGNDSKRLRVAHEHDLSVLRDEHAGLMERANAAERQTRELTDELTLVRLEHDRLITELDAKSEALESANRLVGANEVELHEAVGRLEHLEKTRAEAVTSSHVAEGRCAELIEEVASLRLEKRQTQEDLSLSQQTVVHTQEFEGRCAELTERVASLRLEKVKMQGDLSLSQQTVVHTQKVAKVKADLEVVRMAEGWASETVVHTAAVGHNNGLHQSTIYGGQRFDMSRSLEAEMDSAAADWATVDMRAKQMPYGHDPAAVAQILKLQANYEFALAQQKDHWEDVLRKRLAHEYDISTLRDEHAGLMERAHVAERQTRELTDELTSVRLEHDRLTTELDAKSEALESASRLAVLTLSESTQISPRVTTELFASQTYSFTMESANMQTKEPTSYEDAIVDPSTDGDLTAATAAQTQLKTELVSSNCEHDSLQMTLIGHEPASHIETEAPAAAQEDTAKGAKANLRMAAALSRATEKHRDVQAELQSQIADLTGQVESQRQAADRKVTTAKESSEAQVIETDRVAAMLASSEAQAASRLSSALSRQEMSFTASGEAAAARQSAALLHRDEKNAAVLAELESKNEELIAAMELVRLETEQQLVEVRGKTAEGISAAQRTADERGAEVEELSIKLNGAADWHAAAQEKETELQSQVVELTAVLDASHEETRRVADSTATEMAVMENRCAESTRLAAEQDELCKRLVEGHSVFQVESQSQIEHLSMALEALQEESELRVSEATEAGAAKVSEAKNLMTELREATAQEMGERIASEEAIARGDLESAEQAAAWRLQVAHQEAAETLSAALSRQEQNYLATQTELESQAVGAELELAALRVELAEQVFVAEARAAEEHAGIQSTLTSQIEELTAALEALRIETAQQVSAAETSAAAKVVEVERTAAERCTEAKHLMTELKEVSELEVARQLSEAKNVAEGRLVAAEEEAAGRLSVAMARASEEHASVQSGLKSRVEELTAALEERVEATALEGQVEELTAALEALRIETAQQVSAAETSAAAKVVEVERTAAERFTEVKHLMAEMKSLSDQEVARLVAVEATAWRDQLSEAERVAEERVVAVADEAALRLVDALSVRDQEHTVTLNELQSDNSERATAINALREESDRHVAEMAESVAEGLAETKRAASAALASAQVDAASELALALHRQAEQHESAQTRSHSQMAELMAALDNVRKEMDQRVGELRQAAADKVAAAERAASERCDEMIRMVTDLQTVSERELVARSCAEAETETARQQLASEQSAAAEQLAAVEAAAAARVAANMSSQEAEHRAVQAKLHAQVVKLTKDLEVQREQMEQRVAQLQLEQLELIGSPSTIASDTASEARTNKSHGTTVAGHSDFSQRRHSSKVVSTNLIGLEEELRDAMGQLESLRREQVTNLHMLRRQEQTIQSLSHGNTSQDASVGDLEQLRESASLSGTTVAFQGHISTQLQRWSEIGGQLMERLGDLTGAVREQHRHHEQLLQQLAAGTSPHAKPSADDEPQQAADRTFVHNAAADSSSSSDNMFWSKSSAPPVQQVPDDMVPARPFHCLPSILSLCVAAKNRGASMEAANVELQAIVGAIRDNLPDVIKQAATSLKPPAGFAGAKSGAWLSEQAQSDLKRAVSELLLETKHANLRYEYQRKLLVRPQELPTKSQ